MPAIESTVIEYYKLTDKRKISSQPSYRIKEVFGLQNCGLWRHNCRLFYDVSTAFLQLLLRLDLILTFVGWISLQFQPNQCSTNSADSLTVLTLKLVTVMRFELIQKLESQHSYKTLGKIV